MRIYPRENVLGEFEVPGDKSITHRALILASVAEGKSTIVNPLFCDDTKSTISALKKLGVKFKYKQNTIEVKPPINLNRGQKLDCGNSGTTMRLLCGLIAGDNCSAILIGDKSLSLRPMDRIKTPLQSMGAVVALKRMGRPPVLVEGGEIVPTCYEMPIDSAQVKSSILLCGLMAGVKTQVVEKNPTRNHTEILLKHMGGDIEVDNKKITLNKSKLVGGELEIVGDISVASYFIVLGVLKGKVKVRNVGINPTRMGLVNVLKRMGADITIANERVVCGELVADITAKKSKLKATHVMESEIPSIIDELPILAVAMGVSEGESIVSGAGELTVKESNRIDGIVNLINGLNGDIKRFEDGYIIKGVSAYHGGSIITNGDHRLVMSGAIGLTCSLNGGVIDNAECVSVSFPEFFERLNQNKLALVGNNISKSYSPVIHNYLYASQNKRTYSYTIKEIQDGKLKENSNQLKNYTAYNVTHPFKADIIRSGIKLMGESKLLKTVNFVYKNKGYTTDGLGLKYMLEANGIDLVGKKILVLGCGGAGKSIISVLSKSGAEVDVYNRTAKSTLELKKKISTIYALIEMPTCEYDILINATTVGTGDKLDQCPAPEELIKKCKIVCDIIYEPKYTKLLSIAKLNGKIVLNGRDMLFYQAYISHMIMQNKKPSFEEAKFLYNNFKRKGLWNI